MRKEEKHSTYQQRKRIDEIMKRNKIVHKTHIGVKRKKEKTIKKLEGSACIQKPKEEEYGKCSKR